MRTMCKCQCGCTDPEDWWVFCSRCSRINWSAEPGLMEVHLREVGTGAREVWGKAVKGDVLQVWVPRCPTCWTGPRSFREPWENIDKEQPVVTLERDCKECGQALLIRADLRKARGAHDG